LIESFVGLTESSYFTCGVSEILIDDNAHVQHYKIGVEGANAYHVSSTHVRQNRDSRYDLKLFSLGGSLVRNEVYPMLCDEGIESYLSGLTVVGGEQHVDNFTVVEHAKPHSSSNQVFKGIYGGNSRGVFTGTIVVAEQAQKTNAFQSSANLLLSETAQVDTRPQLKIWADDVKCSHGATIGQLDDEALFYLRSRGINSVEAKSMLIRAFANEVLESVGIEQIRDYVSNLVDVALAAA
jgi:Fe-S cluster assembly protein SufD